MFDPVFFAVAVPAVLFAGVSKGGFASGAAFAATPILALVIAPGQALGLMLPLLMVMDATSLRAYWGQWDGAAARVLILGAVPGVMLGAAVYRSVDPDLFRLLIGAVAIGFVAFQMARRSGVLAISARPVRLRVGVVAGVVSGFTSFVAHAGGPPASVYLMMRGLKKTAFQATVVAAFTAINAVKVVPFAALGIFTRETLLASLLLAPVALVGAWLGVRAHRVVPEGVFFAVAYVLLTLTGAKLIWDALT